MALSFEADLFEIEMRDSVPSAAQTDHAKVWVDSKGLIHTSDDGGNELLTPMARVQNSANISIATSTTTPLTFDTDIFDTDGIHDTGSNTDRLTCQTAGLYLFTASVWFDSNATGYREIQISIDGVGIIVRERKVPISGVATPVSVTGGPYPMEVGEYAILSAWQNSGGSLNILNVSIYSPVFSMVRVGS